MPKICEMSTNPVKGYCATCSSDSYRKDKVCGIFYGKYAVFATSDGTYSVR